MWKPPAGFGFCQNCGELYATLERGRCQKCRTKEGGRVRENIWEAIRGQCEVCGNVALLGYGDWCDECNEIRDEHCEIVERLRAALRSTVIDLSRREREILTLRMRTTARRTARRCRIATGVVASLETRVLQASAN